MLVAAISDTHLPPGAPISAPPVFGPGAAGSAGGASSRRGARRLPEACLERLRGAELILHAGDLLALSVLEELRTLGPPVHAVHGNADEPALRALLPKELTVEVGGLRIGMTHVPGPRAGREERLVRRFPGCAAVVYGHTHVPQVERHGDVWILNPGSPTERRRAPAHTMLVLDVRAGRIRPELLAVDP